MNKKVLRCLIVTAVSAVAVLPLSAVDSLRPCENGHSKLAEKATTTGAYYWQDEALFPQAAADYVSKHSIRSLASAGHNHTFGGRSLEIAAGGYWIKAGGTETFGGVGGLVLSGSYLGDWGYVGEYRIKGTGIRVTATSPEFGIYPASDITAVNCAKARLVFDAPLLSASDAALSIGENVKITNADGYQTMSLFLVDDCSAYRGSFEIRAGGIVHYVGTSTAFPANLAVRNRGTLVVSNAVSVASLTLDEGSSVTAWKPLEVADCTYAGGTLTIGLDAASTSQGALVFQTLNRVADAKLSLSLVCTSKLAVNADLTAFAPVLTVPVSSGLTEADIAISLSSASSVVPGLPNVRLTHTDDTQTGVRSFSLTAFPVVTLQTGDANNTSSSFTNGYSTSNWSDGLFPHFDADYLVQGGLTLRSDKNGSEVTFGGSSLVLDGGSLGLKGPIRIADLKIAYTGSFLSTITSYGIATNRVSGGTITVDGSLRFGSAPYANAWKDGWGLSNGAWPADLRPRYTFVDSALVGTSEVSVRLNTGNKDEDFQLPCYFEFAGDNSRFTGHLTIQSVYQPYYGSVITNEELASVLVIRSAANLGGKLAAFDPWSVSLSRGALWARETLTLDDPNRGIDIAPEGGRFIVSEGKTMTILGAITQRGMIRKEGPGTLALGGGLAFNASRDPVPGSGPNDFIVVEGAVRPASTNAFDGLKMTFSAGADIEIDADTADAGLVRYGLRNVKCETPFVSAGKIPVRVKSQASRLRHVTICTVSGDAPDLTEAFDVTTSVADCGTVKVVKTANGDGTVTYSAKFLKGFALIFR